MRINLKNILTYLGIALVSGALVWFLKPCNAEPEVVTQIQEVVVQENCDSLIQKYTLTSQDSFEIYTTIKKGLPKKDIGSPKITEVRQSTSVPEDMLTTFEKEFDWGLTYGKIKFQVRAPGSAKIEQFEIEHQTDTVLAKEIYKTVETVILTPAIKTVEKKVIVPQVVPNPAMIGVSGGLQYTPRLRDKVFYSAGVSYTTGTGMQFAVEKFISESGGQIQVSVPVFKFKD